MAHVLEIADAAYQALVDAAQDSGKTPQQLVEEWLLDLNRSSSPQHDLAASEAEIPVGYDPARDPLADFLGAFASDVPDLVARHDHYLAEAYADIHPAN
jgi:hypothetical protein